MQQKRTIKGQIQRDQDRLAHLQSRLDDFDNGNARGEIVIPGQRNAIVKQIIWTRLCIRDTQKILAHHHPKTKWTHVTKRSENQIHGLRSGIDGSIVPLPTRHALKGSISPPKWW